MTMTGPHICAASSGRCQAEKERCIEHEAFVRCRGAHRSLTILCKNRPRRRCLRCRMPFGKTEPQGASPEDNDPAKLPDRTSPIRTPGRSSPTRPKDYISPRARSPNCRQTRSHAPPNPRPPSRSSALHGSKGDFDPLLRAPLPCRSHLWALLNVGPPRAPSRVPITNVLQSAFDAPTCASPPRTSQP